MYDNLRIFFENIKSLGFWRRVFGWRRIRTLSYDAYDEFTNLTENLNILNRELANRDTRIADLEKIIEKN
ncbi:MAG: hypothetical protein MUP53_05390, partial [Bacteroidales bacterium]|nr:hypothetical protein [Bacteroidales bacterium]